MAQKEYYILQHKDDPEVFYKHKRFWRHGNGYISAFAKCKRKNASEFKNLDQIKGYIDEMNSINLKSDLVGFITDFKIIKVTEISSTEESEIQPNSEISESLQQSVKMQELIDNTHYSVAELYSRLRLTNKDDKFTYILHTKYDRLQTSKICSMFEEQGLEFIKNKGNFAFSEESHLVAAQIICSSTYKTFKLT